MVVLFDGVCNLCNGAVDFAIRRDPQARLQFAAQQSEAGQRLLASLGASEDMGSSIVVVDGAAVYTESRAILEILRGLRMPWPLLYGFRLLPPFLRNPLYRWIARHRYRWFGKRESCRLPSEAERGRFLS
ncbi:MAG: thiol-disulfide oxidoreductase DCC family protein [Verrucomicrobia bacterium]|nr:thiol-disulfide oxidoreductase DCC family protein [Verrucomicrobiota bacterium]